MVAVHDDERVSLALTNMGGRQLAVDLSGVANRLGANGAFQTRLNYHKGKVVFEPEHVVDATAIPVDVNETTVIRLKLKQKLSPVGTLTMQRHYGPATAVKSAGEPLAFKVNVGDTKDVASARLVIGLHRRGLTEPIVVEVNATPVTVDAGDAAEFTEFFAPLDADVPSELIRGQNEVKVHRSGRHDDYVRAARDLPGHLRSIAVRKVAVWRRDQSSA